MVSASGLKRDAAFVCPLDQGTSAARVISKTLILAIRQPMRIEMVFGDIDSDRSYD